MTAELGRVVITGGAGFVGSHLCERFLAEGSEVVCADNLVTGNASNVEHLRREPGFTFVEADVGMGLAVDGPVDAILHCASPASPVHYLELPIQTLHVGAFGTRNLLELARVKEARFLLASTSEVYGEPLEHPQKESYWGNVNPVGPRSVYDEAKRFAEALTMAYHRAYGLRTRIVRIFNTIGERMRPDDGRAVPAFVTQALRGSPLTVHGDGSQTRSIGYVGDLVDGIGRLVRSDVVEPVNIGNPEEHTVLDVAKMVIRITGSSSEISFVDRPVDDPTVRRPDVTRARELLGWEPKVGLEEALERTVRWFRTILGG